MLEQPFKKQMQLALGSLPHIRCWIQNTGSVEVVKRGKIVGVFTAGPPTGCADISGIVSPWGFRLEVETKGAETKMRPGQGPWRKMVERFGGVYVLLRYDESQSMANNVATGCNAVASAIVTRALTLRASFIDV